MTWKLVRTRPRLSKITPEPRPGRRNSEPPGPSGPKNCLKKSWKKGSSRPGLGRRREDFFVAEGSGSTLIPQPLLLSSEELVGALSVEAVEDRRGLRAFIR